MVATVLSKRAMSQTSVVRYAGKMKIIKLSDVSREPGHTAYLRERDALRTFSKSGLVPRLEFFSNEAGFLVIEFVEGAGTSGSSITAETLIFVDKDDDGYLSEDTGGGSGDLLDGNLIRDLSDTSTIELADGTRVTGWYVEVVDSSSITQIYFIPTDGTVLADDTLSNDVLLSGDQTGQISTTGAVESIHVVIESSLPTGKGNEPIVKVEGFAFGSVDGSQDIYFSEGGDITKLKITKMGLGDNAADIFNFDLSVFARARSTGQGLFAPYSCLHNIRCCFRANWCGKCLASPKRLDT